MPCGLTWLGRILLCLVRMSSEKGFADRGASERVGRIEKKAMGKRWTDCVSCLRGRNSVQLRRQWGMVFTVLA